ncbi:hypothetical protein IW262DRAFT_1465855 [Armillaria fumosa]|nr:hypothetical protein IW262DRAFT_1465855 [Armillaria fumosa]
MKFSAIVTVFAAAFIAVAGAAPVKDTNARRMAAGLPLLPPVRRGSGTNVIIPPISRGLLTLDEHSQNGHIRGHQLFASLSIIGHRQLPDYYIESHHGLSSIYICPFYFTVSSALPHPPPVRHYPELKSYH